MHGLTVEGVPARAGVAKTTIYRRWRSKDELAMAVLLDMVRTVVAVPDLHDTRQELVAFVQGAVARSAARRESCRTARIVQRRDGAVR